MAYNGPYPHSVPIGGTGASTLTGVVSAHGTSAFTASSITQYAVLVGGASQAVVSVPDVAVGSVLVSGGASANPAYALNSSVGTWVLIAQNLPSGVATSTFAITNKYNNYRLLVTNLSSSSTGSMQVQIDTGSGAITSGYLGGINTNPYNSTTLTNVNISSGLMLSSYGATTDFISADMLINNATSGVDYIQSSGMVTIFNTTGPALTAGVTGSSYDTPTQVAVNLVVSCTAGNITGTLSLYGLLEQ